MMRDWLSEIIYRLWERAEKRRRHEWYFKQAVINTDLCRTKSRRGIKSIKFTDRVS
jgi:hypothetical protein